MKLKLIGLILAGCLFSACASGITFTDAAGWTAEIENPRRVVSLYNSYGDAWLVSGGSLAGNIAEGEAAPGAINLGTHLNPNMELFFSLNPDFALLSADTSTHKKIAAMLDEAGVPYIMLSAHHWRDYMENIRLFTQITVREDLYNQQLETVQQPIEAMIAEAKTMSAAPTALLIRAHSTAVKARNSENTVAGGILRDMGFINIADGNSALCEGIGMEAIMMEDPDFIFAVLQGSGTDAAEKNLAVLTGNPAWNTLSAVRNGRFYILDRDLFHYHPNSRWAEAYRYILDILKEHDYVPEQ